MHKEDTIAAIATAQGQGGIAIVRISGADAESVLLHMFSPAGKPVKLMSHRMYYGYVVDEQGEHMDECMAVLMRAPASYTREDVAELQCHGGRYIAEKVLMRALTLGARPAEPGEFTKRAFLNGRIDLTQAEAVMSVISAGCEAQSRASLRQLEGGVSGFIRETRQKMLAMLSEIEAATDFPEEIEEEATSQALIHQGEEIVLQLRKRADERRARVVREGISVVLAGKPNVGKSSLMNAITLKERAIVTEVPGTTRDVLTERLTVGGILIELSDTAGQRDTLDPVEKVGVERAKRAEENADLVLCVFDATLALAPEEKEEIDRMEDRYIPVFNKADLVKNVDAHHLPKRAVLVSAVTGQGMDVLMDKIAESVAGFSMEEGMLTESRHIVRALKAADCVERTVDALREGQPTDVAAVDLWEAIRLLGEITGEEATEDLVSEIFKRFCVGK